MYNFQAAIKAGTTPQQITNYLASKGRQSEADEYFGKIQPSKAGLLQNMGHDISQAFQGGINQFKQAAGDINQGNPIQGGWELLKGATGVAAAPFAPITKPIGQGVQKYADAVAGVGQDTPNDAFGNFANSKAGQVTAQGAGFVADAANVAGTVGGFMSAPKVAGAVNTGVEGVMQGANKGVSAVGKGLKGVGEHAYGLTIAPEEATAKAMMNADAGLGSKPITEANTAARQGLVGTEYGLGVQAKKVSSDIWNKQIQPKLAAVKQKVDMKSFLSDVEKTIKKTGDLTRRGDLTEALAKVKEDYAKVSKVSLEKLQNYKEGWAEFVPEASYKGKPIGSSLKAIHDVMASKARDIIYKNIGEAGKQAYLDYGNLQSIIKSGIKSITGDPAAKSLSRNVWQAIMNKAITPAATGVGKALYKTGEALDTMGKTGSKSIKDAVGLSIKDVSPNALKLEEMGSTLNRLEKQYQAKPTAQNLKALKQARESYQKLNDVR